MHISIKGNGSALVLLHGFCESSKIWSPYIDAFQNDFRVVCIDLPGHGQSASQEIESQLTIDSVAESIHKLLAHNDIHQYFVIGHSLGGYIALALAELHPESLTGFGLFQSAALADDEAKRAVRDKVVNYIEAHGVDNFTETFVPGLFAPENKIKLAGAIKAIQKEAAKTSAEGVIAFAKAMKSRPDRMNLLSTFPKLIFIIGSEQDPAVPLPHTEEMISNISKGDSLILKTAGHNGFIEEKEICIEFIRNFLWV